MLSAVFGFIGIPGIIEQVLRIFNTSLGIVSPALTAFFELLVWYIKVLWNGLLDIVDSWMTVLTVLTLVLGTWFYAKLPLKDSRLAQCQAQVELLKKKQAPAKKTTSTQDFKWPWEWFTP